MKNNSFLYISLKIKEKMFKYVIYSAGLVSIHIEDVNTKDKGKWYIPGPLNSLKHIYGI